VASPQKTEPTFKHPGWRRCIRDFLADIRARNPKATTHTTYVGHLRRFFLDPGKRPDTYTKGDVEQYLIASFDDPSTPVGPHTRNGRLIALGAFFRYAKTYRVPNGNGDTRPLVRKNWTPPTEGVAWGKTTTKRRQLSPSQVKAFFQAIEEHTRNPVRRARDRALFMLYLRTGRRLREIAGLLWGDIEIQEMRGKNGQKYEGWVYHWRGKGHVEKDDCAEIPQGAVVALKAYLVLSERWGHLTATDPLFPGWRNQPMSWSNIVSLFRQYRELAGIDAEKGGTHSLRRRAARDRYEVSGHDLLEVQQFLRHKDIHTTMIYVQGPPEEADAFAAELDGRYSNL
jgi:site-specific recombinase XerD